MTQYKAIYFPDSDSRPQSSSPTFPHVILLVATWDSITPDVHNEPQKFCSAIGKSISNLKNSRLIDLDYSNVVVVVTNSMSCWDQFDDYESEDEKKHQWCIQADVRKVIILDLQRRAFPKSIPWPVVFVENGGGSRMDGPYPTLPNGEHSHQNLFNTIFDIMCDLAGLQALRVLTGAGSLNSVGKPETLLSPETIQDMAVSIIMLDAYNLFYDLSRNMKHLRIILPFILIVMYSGSLLTSIWGLHTIRSVVRLDVLAFSGSNRQI